MSLERVENLIQSFNSGEYEDDIEPYFNNILNFLKFVKKYGLLDEIDLSVLANEGLEDETWEFLVDNGVIQNLRPDDVPLEFLNRYLLYELDHNYEKTIMYIIDNYITDVEVRNDGFYLYLKDREELADFFCEGRRGEYGSKDIAKQVLGEDGLGHEWYFDNTRKPYETVDELDESNITKLKDIIFKEIGDKELSLENYHSDFFEYLSEDQGTEGYFRIRPQDLNDLVKDSESINELCDNDLDELGSNLNSLYHWAENSAYEDEVYSLVYDGLNDYFEGKIDEVPIKSGEKTRYLQYIKIRDFVDIIKSFLNENIGSTYNDSFLDYFGSFNELMKGLFNEGSYECIDFRTPDYPDYRMIQKNINDMFDDYI
jgi:hypothetical protein